MNDKEFSGATLVEIHNDDVRYQPWMMLEKDGIEYLVTISNDHRFVITKASKINKKEI